MKKSSPRLALDLARSGISVLHCNARELWQPLGSVALTAPDFELALARLRKSTAENFGEDFKTEVWLPSDQVMFRALRLETQTPSQERTEEIKSAFAAMSRLASDELCLVEGNTDDKGFTHVAAVSMATWTEAVAFAEKWGFNSRTISTRLPAEGFDMPPVFTPPHREAPKAMRKLPGVIAAGLAMALMLPAALQLSSGQYDDPTLMAFPAKIVVGTEFEAGAGPEVSMLSGAPFGAVSEEASNVQLPSIAEPVKTESFFERAEADADLEMSQKAGLTVPSEIGPDVLEQAAALQFKGDAEAIDLTRPKLAAAVILPAKIALFEDINPAPEVVDQHALLWVAKLPVQPAFRSTGPDFHRPSLNALRRSPGVLRLPRKLNFGPDQIPGLSVISSDDSKDFLRRTLNNIEFDDVREQAMLDFAPRAPFADHLQRQVAQITADTLVLRPAKRIVSTQQSGTELARPVRRKRPAEAVVADVPVNPPRADPMIEALLPPPDPGLEASPEPPNADTSVAVTRPNEAVLSTQAPSVLVTKPARRPREQAEGALDVPEQPRPPRRESLEAAAEVGEAAPLAVVSIDPPKRRPIKDAAVAEPVEPVVQEQVVATAALPVITMSRPVRRKGVRTQTASTVRPPEGPISKYALGSASSPKARPVGLSAVAAKIRKKRNSVDAVVARTQEPRKSVPASRLSLPSNASVKKAATIRSGINLRKISLLGVSGSSSKRSALIRLPRGGVVKVKRGAKVDGWRVSAIGEQSVRLQKGSRSQVLRLPN